MHKYFSTYFEYLEKQDKKTRLALLLSAFFLLFLLVLIITLPFQSGIFSLLFGKDRIIAALKEENVCPQIELPKEFTKKPDREKSILAIGQLRPTSETFVAEFKNYKNLSADERKNQKEQFMSQAIARKKILLEVMRYDPDTAHQALLPEQDREEAQSMTTNCIEEPTTLEGDLEIHHADYVDNTSETVYYISTGPENRTRIHPTGHALQLFEVFLTKRNIKVKVEGYKLDNEVLVDQATESKTQQSYFAPKAEAITPWAFGEKKIIVILINTLNVQVAYDKPKIQSLFTRVGDYYKEQSYGKTFFTAVDVVGPYTFNTTTPLGNCDVGFTGGAMAKADADVDFTKYTHVAAVIPVGLCGREGNAVYGMSSRTPITSLYDGGTVTMRSVYNSDLDLEKSLSPRIVAHELGHNHDVDHATFLPCAPGSGCYPINGYMDPYDVMGGYPFWDRTYHMSAMRKEKIGWLTSQNIQEVTTSGTYTIYPLETAPTDVKALKIFRNKDASGNNQYIYIEYRRPIGFDETIPAPVGGTTTKTNAVTGALIRYQYVTIPDHYAGTSHLIDTNPESTYPIPEPYTSALQVNESFTDPTTGAVIKVTNRTDTALTIQVTLGGPTSTPTVTPTPGGPTNTPTPTRTPTPTPTPTTIPTTSTVTLTPIADTFVEKETPDKNYGSHANVRVDENPKDTGLLKFDTAAFIGKTIVKATLRLYVTDASTVSVSFLGVGESWGENGVTWNTRPNIGNLITTIPVSPLNAYTNVDITSYIAPRIGNTIAFALNTSSTDAFAFATKESGPNKPQLVITYR